MIGVAEEAVPKHQPERIFMTRKVDYTLDSTSQALLQIMTSIEAEGYPCFGLTGGFVRNLLGRKHYNDFDICSQDVDIYRYTLDRMGLLKMAQRNTAGIIHHDRFMNPYDIGQSSNNLHWMDTNELQGYPPPTFDFSVNEFTLKSDGWIHAPTYAWRHWDARLIKANRRPNMVWTTNLILRAVRFAALLDFHIDKDDFAMMKKRLETSDVDTVRCIQGFKKMMNDGVEYKAMPILLELEFPMTSIYKDMYSLKSFYEKKLIAGEAYAEADVDYHDMEGNVIDGLHARTAIAVEPWDLVRTIDPFDNI
jgi:hypothetical protein